MINVYEKKLNEVFQQIKKSSLAKKDIKEYLNGLFATQVLKD